MLLVIFGAGASYDSVPHFPPRESLVEQYRPPLANELFENRPDFVEIMGRYDTCLPLVPLLRLGIPVEQQLARFQEQAASYPERHRQLAAIRYYLQVMLRACQRRWFNEHKGITNYATVLDAIERWRFEAKEHVCFVTFNYDTMLEDAMKQVLNVHMQDLASYIKQGNYVLIKLHGSVNWGRVIEGGFPVPPVHSQQQLINVAADLKISDSYVLIEDDWMLHESGRLIFPALAIPVEKKHGFECPQEHVDVLAGVIPRVTKIITIGWRATEAHFLEMLRSRLTGLAHAVGLMIVSGDRNGTSETLQNLGIRVVADRYAAVTGGFTALTHNLGMLDTLLRQSP